MNFEIDISAPPVSGVDVSRLKAAVQCGLQIEGVSSAVISVSIVDNQSIHEINREHLQHDYPTDVISFQLDWSCDEESLERRMTLPDGRSAGAAIEGEIIASHEYAEEMAARCGWSPQDELTLYVVHGMLHICGYDDLTLSEKEFMRARERVILKEMGLEPSYPQDEWPPEESVTLSKPFEERHR